MAISYTWKSKTLKSDEFGDATELVLAMEGLENGLTHRSLLTVSFGGDDIKAQSDWTDAEIDIWAETHRANLEATIASQFNP